MGGFVKFPVWLAALVLPALLSGCGSVMTAKPLPQSALTWEQREQFEGVWVFAHGEGPAYLIAFECDGTARLGEVAWEKGRFRTRQYLMTLAQDADGGPASGFLSIQGEKRKDRAEYALVRYRFLSGDDLVVWLPVTKPFNAAIEAGRLEGKIYDDDTEITGPPQALLGFLRDPANAALFDYENPLLFRRAAGIAGETEQHGCAKK